MFSMFFNSFVVMYFILHVFICSFMFFFFMGRRASRVRGGGEGASKGAGEDAQNKPRTFSSLVPLPPRHWEGGNQCPRMYQRPTER